MLTKTGLVWESVRDAEIIKLLNYIDIYVFSIEIGKYYYFF